MIRRSLVLLAMLAVAGTALAQAPPSPPPQWQGHYQGKDAAQWRQKAAQWRQKMEQRRLERLSVLLDLTPAQKQQVQAIFAAQRTRMQQTMQQARAAMRAAHTDTQTKLGQVLNPTQMKKLKLLMPRRHHRFFRGRRGPMGWKHGRPQHGAGPPPGAGLQ